MKAKYDYASKTVSAFLCILATAAQDAFAGEFTAFDLVKEGNRYVSEDARDRLVQIRSDKSVGSLTPSIWYVVYFDPDATAKATEVKFAAGRKVTVKRPARVLELFTEDKNELPKEKLKIDSYKAIKIAVAEPILKNLTVTATRLELERWNGIPVWKVRLWAQKLRRPNRDASVGEVFISAEEGKVVKTDLDPGNID